MEEKVKKFIVENGILDHVEKVLLAVSGGADSMALADFMLSVYPQYQYVIAHVNHLLRAESSAEMALVASFAKKRGVAFEHLSVDVAALAKRRKAGIEETGRNVRYEFFAACNCDIILTAHHKDDDAETILGHLIRGCGLKGLCGIAPKESKLARPFLCVGKRELVAYCEEHDVPFVIDKSNEDTIYQRNKIRHEVLPLLQEMNPNIVAGLCRLGDIAQEEEIALDQIASDLYPSIAVLKEGSLFLEKKALDAVAMGLRRRLIRMAGKQQNSAFDYDTVTKILALKTGKELHFGKEGRVCQNGRFYVFDKREDTAGMEGEPPVFSFSEPGIFVTPFGRCEISAIGTDDKEDKDNSLFLSAAMLTEGVTLRTWRSGDRLFLKGGGSKKVSEWFIDQKIPKESRKQIILLAQGQRVLWVVGYHFCLWEKKPDYQLKLYEKNNETSFQWQISMI